MSVQPQEIDEMNREERSRRWNVRKVNDRWIATNPYTGDTIEATSEGDLLDQIESAELAKTIPPLKVVIERVKESGSGTDDKGKRVPRIRPTI
jgi:hypothetical protein